MGFGDFRMRILANQGQGLDIGDNLPSVSEILAKNKETGFEKEPNPKCKDCFGRGYIRLRIGKDYVKTAICGCTKSSLTKFRENYLR